MIFPRFFYANSLKLKNFFLGALLCLSLLSCQKEDVILSEKSNTLTADSIISVTNPSGESFSELKYYNYPVINKNIENFSKAFNKLLQDKELRELLKTTALKKFDGDYDVLFTQIAHIKLSDNYTILDRLKEIDNKIESYIAQIPKLQLSIPVHAYSWDTDVIPNLALAPQGIKNERSVTTLKAYNAEGKVVWIDAQKAPEQAIIVVGINERTDLNGKLYTDFTSVPNRSSKARSAYSTEILGRCYFDGLPDENPLEPFWLGDLEMRVRILGSRDGNTPTEFASIPMNISQRCIADENEPGNSDDGCYMGNSLFTWTPVYGDYVNYHWVEEDGGWSITITVSITVSIPNPTSPTQPLGSTGLSAPVTISFMDDDAGNYPIYKQEPYGKYYGSSSLFSFYITTI